MKPTVRNEQTPYAIVIGLDCIQGLQTARILANRHVPVIAVAKSRDYYSCRTNVCKEILFADTGGPELIELLTRLGPTFGAKPVLFPCQDKNVLVISKAQELLGEWYHVVLPEHATVEMMMDKAAFFRHAEEVGLPTPPTHVLRSTDDARAAAPHIDYPCILKPAFRLRMWSKHTKVKAFVADTPAEFLASYEQCRHWADVLIAQRLIKGPDTNHYTVNCYFDRQGEPLVTFTSRKLRQWRPRTGQACLSEEARDVIAEEETLRVFRSVAYRGLGYLEMKRDQQTGKYFIIEPNIGRPTGRSALAEAAGVELLLTMYCDALGLPLPRNRQQSYRGVKWIHIMRDLQASFYYWRRGDLTVGNWWRSIRGQKTYAILSWRDPMPFLAALVKAVPVMLSARERSGDLD
jgi:D-aspartate ligase